VGVKGGTQLTSAAATRDKRNGTAAVHRSPSLLALRRPIVVVGTCPFQILPAARTLRWRLSFLPAKQFGSTEIERLPTLSSEAAATITVRKPASMELRRLPEPASTPYTVTKAHNAVMEEALGCEASVAERVAGP